MKPPIFIMGTGRSGTSVFTRLLGLHPHIWAFRWETQIFSGINGFGEIMLRQFNDNVIKLFTDNLQGRWFHRTVREGQPGAYDAGLFEIIESSKLEVIISTLIEDLNAAHNRPARVKALARLANSIFEHPMVESKAHRWCEKTPRNLLFADLMAEVFPEAKFINVVRDGRDVASSMLQRQFWPVARSNRFECTSSFGGHLTLEKCAHYWACLSRIGQEMKNKLGEKRCLIIKFEDLAEKPETTFTNVLDFLEEPFDSAVLDLNSQIIRKKPQGPVSWSEYANLGRWHHDLSPDQQKSFLKIAGKELEFFGYPV